MKKTKSILLWSKTHSQLTSLEAESTYGKLLINENQHPLQTSNKWAPARLVDLGTVIKV